MPSAMTSDECIDMMNNTNQDPFFFLSLAINGLLLLTTGASELMAASHCKANSLLEFIIHSARGENCKKPEDPLESEINEEV